jgi:hypothetical protein
LDAEVCVRAMYYSSGGSNMSPGVSGCNLHHAVIAHCITLRMQSKRVSIMFLTYPHVPRRKVCH